jgi:hypothetical protein
MLYNDGCGVTNALSNSINDVTGPFPRGVMTAAYASKLAKNDTTTRVTRTGYNTVKCNSDIGRGNQIGHNKKGTAQITMNSQL